MMKSSALVLSLMLSGVVYAAESNGSEYLWQTQSGKFEVTPTLGLYEKMDITARTAGASGSERTSMPITVKGEYGINEMFSAGILLGTDSISTKSKAAGAVAQKSTGMFDPVLFFHGRYNLGMGWLKYGADLSVGFQKGETKANGDTNNATGGNTLTPFAGWEMAAGPGTFGAKLMFDLYKGEGSNEDKSTTPSTTTKTSGGNRFGLAAFYEMGMGMWDLGGALSYHTAASTKSKVASVETTNDDDMSEILLQVYAPVHINEMITILPELHYGMVTWSKATYGAKSASDTGLQVGARFAF